MEILFTLLQFKGFEQDKRQEKAIYMKTVTDVVTVIMGFVLPEPTKRMLHHFFSPCEKM